MTKINLLQLRAPIDLLTIHLRVAEERRLQKTDEEV
jgi:hypothetical protein